MADQRFIRHYTALERHRSEMRSAVRQRRWRLTLVLASGLLATALAYWVLPPLALLVAAVGILAGFFAGITGSSSVPPDQMSGAEGEEKVLRALQSLPENYTIFNQLEIPDPSLPNGRRELDFLIVAPAGLFIVEVKNTGGLIYVRPNESRWPIAHKAGCGGRPGWNAVFNPIQQIQAQVSALDRWLLKNAQTAPIYPILCFARSDVALQDRDSAPLPVLTVPELTEHLIEQNGGSSRLEKERLIKLLSRQQPPAMTASA